MKRKLWEQCIGGVVGILCGVIANAAEPPKDVVSMEQAKATALKKYSGTVKSSELEHEQGKWVYSFDIAQADNKIHEVWVDAKSGKIIKHKIESSREEKKEQTAEQGQ